MALDLGVLSLAVTPDLSNFGRDLNTQIGRQQSGVLKNFGSTGAAFGAAIGAAMVGGIAVAAAGAVAAGAGLYQLGSAFDDAYDRIRTGAGATGSALEDLQGSFRDVARGVPDNFGAVSEAVTTLNQRLGLTGDPLEALSTQFLDLSRVTGTDVATNVETITRVFGDWGISAADQAGSMDELFRASQATGVGFDQLSQTVVQFGGPLRQLGFGFEESIAMIGQFEKEGVNTELVLGSMRQALGQMARAGEDPIATFRRVTDEIKNAGSAGEANAIALKLFGNRAGPDMAAAIREGRFEFGALTDQIVNGTDTIGAAADDTADFAERWGEFRNRMMLALDPVATTVFDALGTTMERVGPQIADFVERALPRVTAWWEANGPGLIATATTVFGAVSAGIRTVVDAVSTVVGWFGQAFGEGGALSGAGAGLTGFTERIAPLVATLRDGLGQVLTNIVQPALAAMTTWWNEQGPTILARGQEIFGTLRDVVGGAMDAIGVIFSGVVATITTLWRVFGDDLVRYITSTFTNLQQFLGGALEVVEGILDVFVGIFTGDWQRFLDGVKSIFSGVWDAITALGNQVWNVLSTVLGVFVSAFQDTWRNFLETVKRVFSEAWENVKNAFTQKWNELRLLFDTAVLLWSTAWQTAVDAIKTYFVNMWVAFIGLFGGFRDTLVTAIGEVIGTYTPGGPGLLGKWHDAVEAVKTRFDAMWTAFTNLFGGFKTSLVTAIEGVIGTYTPGGPGLLGTWHDAVERVKVEFGKMWTAFTSLFGGYATDAVNAIGKVIGAYTVGGGGLLGAWHGAVTAIGDRFGEAWDNLVGSFTGAGSIEQRLVGAFEGLKKAIGDAWKGVKGVFADPVNWVIDNVINKFIGAVNGIAGQLGFSLDIGTVGRLPTAHSGGVVDDRMPTTGGPLRRDERILKTQVGEGIVPRDAMLRLGSDRFNAVRSGSFDEAELPENMRGNVPPTAGLFDFLRDVTSSVADTARNLIVNVARPAVEAAMGPIGGLGDRYGVPGRIAGGAAGKVGAGVLNWISGVSQVLETLIGTAGQLTGDAFALGGGYGARVAGRLSANTADAVAFVRGKWGVRDIGTVGGRPGPSDHPYGKALDAMIGTNLRLGTEIARWFVTNPQQFGTKYVIWHDQINSGSGWRHYSHYLDPNNLDDTLSHRDHPHVSFLAEGGWVTRPTLAMVGEGGGEIVGPEDKLEAIFERVLDRLGGGDTHVHVESGSRDPWEQGRTVALALRMS